MKLLLISGHGAGDPGATATINGTTYKEADETVDMVKRIRNQIKKYKDVSVELYPIERNAYSDVMTGKLQADFSKYDYVLEVHFNACVNDLKGDGRTTGTEIYVTTTDTTKNTETYIVEEIAKLGLNNRGVKSYNWSVINRAKKAEAESALLELCFIDDKDDMDIYLNNKPKIAKAIAAGIARGYGLSKKDNTTKKVPKFIPKPTIKPGATGIKVKRLQRCLNYLGFKGADGKKLTLDGDCGNNTVYALKQFKKKYSFRVNGIYGKKAYNKMKTLIK